MTSSNTLEVWSAKPSHWTQLPWYFLSLAAIIALTYLAIWWALLPAALLLAWTFLEIQCQHYQLTDDGRFVWSHGVLNRHIESIELYRIKDFIQTAPLHLRPLGLANVTMLTSDPSAGGRMTLRAIRNSDAFVQRLRSMVEASRTAKGVREIDAGMDF